jgi:hypothetical protein
VSEPQRIGREPKRITETEDYVAMLGRQIDAYGRRVGEDPAAICYYKDLRQRLDDAVNVGLATAQGKQGGWSLREIAAIFGISNPGVLKRIVKGREIIARRETAAGVTRLADMPKPSVPGLRQQRAEWLAERGVEEYRVLPLKGRHRKTA